MVIQGGSADGQATTGSFLSGRRSGLEKILASTAERASEKTESAAVVPALWAVSGVCARWLTVTLLAAAVGSWLVWFAVHLQREQNDQDIRAACRHLMPETADRCFDTVVIQRGGLRR